MPDQPNYLRRLGLIMGGFLFGFALILIFGWELIFYPNSGDPWLIWGLRRLPVVVGAFCIVGAFLLLRKPVQNDPGVPEDDLDNMDGA